MADLDPIAVENFNRLLGETGQTMNGLGSSLLRGKDAFKATVDSLIDVKDSGEMAAQGMKAVGAATVRLTSQIYRGEQGMKKYADALDTAAEAIGTFTFALSAVFGGPLLKAITLATLGLVKFGKAATDQADALFKSYQSISRSGAAAADGLQGVFNMMQDFSLGVDNMDQMNSLIASNAQSLALFQGTVYDGARAMGSIAKDVKESGLRREFQGLGMTVQEQNETLAGFIALQSRLGIQEVKNNKDITASLNRYVAETDAITKLTGANRQKQEELQQAALQTEMFRAKIDRMRASGDIEGANMLMDRYKALGSVSEDLAQGFAESVNGFLITEKAIGAFQLTNGKIQQYAMDRNMKLGVFLEKTGDAVRDGLGGAMGTSAAELNMFRDITGLAYNQLSDFGEITKGAGGKLDDIAAVQARQRELAEKGLKNAVDVAESDLNSMQAMQRFVNLGVNPATSALATLAGVVESLTSLLPKSGKQAAAATGGAVAGAVGGAKLGAMGGAAVGTALLPGVGTAVGGAVGGALGGVAGGLAAFFGVSSMFGGPGATSGKKAAEVLDFDPSGSGSQDRFEQLDDNIKKRVIAAGEQYMSMTGGKKLQINSAMRTREEQERLYALFQSGKGLPAARPGTSSHEKGQAVDIQNYKDPAAVAALNKQGLFQTVQGDPPHFSMMQGYKNGGIANRPSIFGEGKLPEAAVPLPDGRSIPVAFQNALFDDKQATGPKSGYINSMNYTESVRPLSDEAKAAPTPMPELVTGLRDQMNMMGAQLMALQDMVGLMRDQTSISTKILQAANN
jgi:hypothetical protein